MPKTPGVYFFRDKRGRILYIGKAVNLKNRLASYFRSQLGGRTAKLMEKAVRVTRQETASEIEALILESHLIKKHRPPFNVMLRDDKQYFYVEFTDEQFPKVFLSHQIQNTRYKTLNTRFLGPFTDGQALKTALKLLRRIFPYCACKQKHNNYCLNYHIGKCGGICCLKQPEPNFKTQILNFKNEYKKNIGAIKDTLSGKKATLIKNLEKEMGLLAKKEMFKEATELRDKIEKLKKVFENAQILRNTNLQISTDGTNNEWVIKELKKLLKLPSLPRRIEGYDISNIQGKFAVGVMVVFINGYPNKSQYRKFRIKSGDSMSPNYILGDTAMLKEVLIRRFNHPEWPRPDLIIVDGGKVQLNATAKVIYDHRKIRGFTMSQNQIPIIALTKNKKHRGSHIFVDNKKSAIPLTKLPPEVRNLILQVDSEAHRFAISYYRNLHRRLK